MKTNPNNNQKTQLRIPPWNPDSHQLQCTVQQYIPGEQLLYQNNPQKNTPWLLLISFLSIGTLFGALFQTPLKGALISTSSIGLILLFQWKSGAYLPTLWDFNLQQKTLQIHRGESSQKYCLEHLDAVLLKHVCTKYQHSQRPGFGNYNGYNSLIILKGLDEHNEFVIAQTGELREDPENSYYDGLAFANMLAACLFTPLLVEQTVSHHQRNS